MLKVDLHCHSNVSDGVLAPAAVAAYARKGGVDAWALTDHDELKGIKAARQAATDLGMHFVPGVEISVTWGGETVHVVGLQVNEDEPVLTQGLAATRNGRDARGREIGACGSTSEVFRKYLTEGKPGYVPHRWATLAEAVGWIRKAGGIPVIAHPGRYRFTPVAEGAMLDEFKQLGGNAIEVVTGSHTPDQYETYAEVARRYGFLASRGTDFHAPGEARVEFDKLPPLPAGLTPVWHDWF